MSLTLVRSTWNNTTDANKVQCSICHAKNVHYNFCLVWMNVLIVHHSPTFITSSSKPLKDQGVFGKVSQPKTEC